MTFCLGKLCGGDLGSPSVRFKFPCLEIHRKGAEGTRSALGMEKAATVDRHLLPLRGVLGGVCLAAAEGRLLGAFHHGAVDGYAFDIAA
jgi:hypothetical protein